MTTGEKPWYRDWEMWAIGLVVALFLFGIAFGDDRISLGCSIESHSDPVDEGG